MDDEKGPLLLLRATVDLTKQTLLFINKNTYYCTQVNL